MPITSISFAPVMEDIHLLRALQDVAKADGFYIDVGANDPEFGSVTKLFYDKGWRGVNIDPSPRWMARLREQRPRDINIEAAISDVMGPITFFDHEGGLGTTIKDIAMEHMITRGDIMPSYEVEAMTLTSICELYAPNQIHFLKIDVEGAEKSVLKSMDFRRYRPWILCIECHYPTKPEVQLYESWEPSLISFGYQFSYTDQINRYYVAQEHSERMASFQYPAHFYIHADVLRRMRFLENRLKTLEKCIADIKTNVNDI